MDPELRRCATCSAEDGSGTSPVRLKACGRCMRVYYCCVGHQRDHWQVHRWECGGRQPAAARGRARKHRGQSTEQHSARDIEDAIAASRMEFPEPQVCEAVGGPPGIARVLWINLDHRTDRAHAQEEALAGAGLRGLAERVSAVNGRALDLDSVSPAILTAAAKEQARRPPKVVLGRVLTPGAVGLLITWHTILARIKRTASPHECYLVVEDDAQYSAGFLESLQVVLAALSDVRDWDACAIGYIDTNSRVLRLQPEEPQMASDVVGIAIKLCGASGILINGPGAAAALLDALFPVGPNSQWDLALGSMMSNSLARQEPPFLYASLVPIMSAPLSEAGDTDIQRIPESQQKRLYLEALIRAHVKRGDIGDDGVLEHIAAEAGATDAEVDEAIRTFQAQFAQGHPG